MARFVHFFTPFARKNGNELLRFFVCIFPSTDGSICVSEQVSSSELSIDGRRLIANDAAGGYQEQNLHLKAGWHAQASLLKAGSEDRTTLHI